MHQTVRVAFLVLLIVTASACAGARGALSFDTLQYPVSSSAALYTHDQRAVSGGQLESLGELHVTERIWSTFWSAIPLHGARDVSPPINTQIAQAGGEGAVGLSVETANCGTNYIPLLNWLPIYPGCVLVTVRGQIVRRPPPSLRPMPSVHTAPAPAAAPTRRVARSRKRKS